MKLLKYSLAPLAMLSMALTASQAIADDSPTARPNQTEHQLLKQCMADLKASNSGASAAEMKKTCMAQVKTYQQHPSVTTPSKVPTP